MKKILTFISAFFLFALCLSACGSADASLVDAYLQCMKTNGFLPINTTEQYNQDICEESYSAMSIKGTAAFSYLQMKNEDYARQAMDGLKKTNEERRDPDSASFPDVRTFPEGEYYSLKLPDCHILISRRGKTVLYVSCGEGEIPKIEQCLAELGFGPGSI